jgi:single-strand DNA-binding protein
MSLNKVILMGNMCADPELKQTPSGNSVCSFNIGVSRNFGRLDEKKADFFTVVAWGTKAEFICKYFKKGQAIVVVGELQTRNWTDNQGNKRYATEVVADEVSFAGGKEVQSAEGRAQSEEIKPYVPSAYTQYPTDNFASTQNSQDFEEIPGDESLPF